MPAIETGQHGETTVLPTSKPSAGYLLPPIGGSLLLCCTDNGVATSTPERNVNMTTSTRTKPKSEAKPAAEAPTTPLTGKAKADYDKRVAAQSDPAPKRKTYTPEERIAKLEAELATAREVRDNRAAVAVAQLEVQRAKLVAKRDELNDKIDAVSREIKAVVPITDEEQAARDAAAPAEETDTV